MFLLAFSFVDLGVGGGGLVTIRAGTGSKSQLLIDIDYDIVYLSSYSMSKQRGENHFW